MSSYSQMGHSGSPNARQCHFGMRSIRDGHSQKDLLLPCKLLRQAEGSSSACQANPSLSTDAPMAASIYLLLRPPLNNHKWQNIPLQFQWLHTHLWSAGNIIPVNKKVACNPALLFSPPQSNAGIENKVRAYLLVAQRGASLKACLASR